MRHSKLEGYSSPRLKAYAWLWPLAVLHRFFLWLTLDIVWFALPIKSGKWMRDPIQKVRVWGTSCWESG